MKPFRFSTPEYYRAVGDHEDAPQHAPIIVFAGRSNAGKSSVLNALCGARSARVSGVPGSTRAIQLFHLGDVILADLPGYGYAARPGSRENWRRQITRFLATAHLFCLVTIVDSRRGIGPLDEIWLRLCEPPPAPMLLLLNKIDKLNRQQEKNAVAAATAQTAAHVLPFSATKKTGAEAARRFIIAAAKADGAQQ